MNSANYAQVCFKHFKHISTNMNNPDISIVNFVNVTIFS